MDDIKKQDVNYWKELGYQIARTPQEPIVIWSKPQK